MLTQEIWCQAANIDSICTIIIPVLSVKLIEILAHLYYGKEHEIGKLSTRVNYRCSYNLNTILSFLVHTGYLTYINQKVSMPNQEIKNEWANCSFGETESGTIDSSFQQNIKNSLQAESFETMPLHCLMSQILLNCFCFDIISEHSYYLYFVGIFTAVFGPKTSSNREARHAPYDIAIVFEDMKQLFIFEFKHSKTTGDLERDAENGLKEIHEKKYYNIEQYCQWKCIAIGVSFYLRKMSQLKCDEFEVSL
jgi:PD-(D/E)XK nuclease superfamily